MLPNFLGLASTGRLHVFNFATHTPCLLPPVVPVCYDACSTRHPVVPLLLPLLLRRVLAFDIVLQLGIPSVVVLYAEALMQPLVCQAHAAGPACSSSSRQDIVVTWEMTRFCWALHS